MLQQTQVATVIPYFRRFMTHFPNVKRLAEAPLDAVLARWSGLGYYARARNLHQAAQQIRAEGGRLPRSVDAWMRLPGVGRSTAGAIVSLALGQPAPMLDGNARRVIARYQGLAPQDNAELWRVAEHLLPTRDYADYTQGLMDLGAGWCAPRDPQCASCLLSADCRYANQKPLQEPPSKRRMVPSARTLWVVVVRAPDGQVLLRRREAKGIWGGLWSFPEFEARRQATQWATAKPVSMKWTQAPRQEHKLSHVTLTTIPLCATIPLAEKAHFMQDGQWFDPHQTSVGMAAPVRKLFPPPSSE